MLRDLEFLVFGYKPCTTETSFNAANDMIVCILASEIHMIVLSSTLQVIHSNTMPLFFNSVACYSSLSSND